MPTQDYPFRRYSFYDRRDVAASLEPDYSFIPQRGSWGISGIVQFGNGNYVFFVSFGQKQADHDFDEAVYSNGVVRWQSQPAQTLATPMIQRLVNHNYLVNDILLFLRTKTEGPYMFMGFLKYVNHDEQRERPVHFHWQILDFDGTRDYESLLGLRLEPVSQPTDTNVSQTNTARQVLVSTSAPTKPRGVKGVPVETSDFRRSPVDYEERDKNNRKLGKVGEDLVNAYEKSALLEIGRQDLADRVELVCRTIGDQAGFDVRSFDRGTFEETHIEVKNTSGPAATPFFMSAAEVEYARTCARRYVIYRLYEYKADSEQINFFKIENAKDTLEFTAATFRVRQKL